MKRISVYVLLALLTLNACNTNNGSKEDSVSFGIYETVMVQDLSAQEAGELAGTNIIMNSDPLSPVVGYSHVDSTASGSVADAPTLAPAAAPAFRGKGEDSVGFLLTAQPVDPEKNYYAVVAVKNQSVITISDIKKTKADKNAVEIYFTREGTVKWAEITRNNTGKMVAFAIDERVYTMPTVMAEILNGKAVINDLENEETAVRISEALNAAL